MNFSNVTIPKPAGANAPQKPVKVEAHPTMQDTVFTAGKVMSPEEYKVWAAMQASEENAGSSPTFLAETIANHKPLIIGAAVLMAIVAVLFVFRLMK